jgi:hypothetical protein
MTPGSSLKPWRLTVVLADHADGSDCPHVSYHASEQAARRSWRYRVMRLWDECVRVELVKL